MDKTKIIILSILITTTLLTLSTVNAVDNITVDSDTVIDKDLQVQKQETLDLTFDDEKKKYTIKVNDKSGKTLSTQVYYYETFTDEDNNSKTSVSRGYVNSERQNSYRNGKHELKITKYGTPIFNINFIIKNNMSLTPDIHTSDIDYIHLHIENGKTSRGKQLTNGDNLLKVSDITNSRLYIDDSLINVYYRDWMENGQDIRGRTKLIAPKYNNGVFDIVGYDYKKAYSCEPYALKLKDQYSWDGKYDYQYKKVVKVPVKYKVPTYYYKKVRNGYKWKHYKTKWITKKYLTGEVKKGKAKIYGHKIWKLASMLVFKKSKLLKTVRRKNKVYTYFKLQVYYYKKVKKYKKVKVYDGYTTITEKEDKDIWVNARGTAEEISKYVAPY